MPNPLPAGQCTAVLRMLVSLAAAVENMRTTIRKSGSVSRMLMAGVSMCRQPAEQADISLIGPFESSTSVRLRPQCAAHSRRTSRVPSRM